MKYYLIAGEASGDLHGANLIKALFTYDKNAQMRCWGGNLMQQAGATLVKHYKDLAFMGFVEVILNLKTIYQNIEFCKKDIIAYNPSVLILIDYPGFNLRIADFARKKGIQVFYYISPQVWAWNSKRVIKMKQNINQMFVILPFEKDFFAKYQWQNVHFVGHPLLDAIENNKNACKEKLYLDPNKIGIIALLPGSRKQEIKIMLPIMLQVIKYYPNYQFVVAAAPSQPLELYKSIIKDTPVQVSLNKTYNLLQQSTAALVTSGTATLETALHNVPQVVCYKGNWLSYKIAKKLINIKYISLVNLIANKLVVHELIQNDLTYKNLVAELAQILPTGNLRNAILQDYEQLKTLLGGVGASERAAKLMYNFLIA